MNVTDMMKQIYGNEIYTAAYLMDRGGVEKIEASYQEAWDSGKGFTPCTMFSHRKDDEAEKKECASQMLNSLRDLVTKEWVSRYSRDEIVSLIDILIKCPKRHYTRIRLVADLEMDVGDIAREWNKLNPGDRPVYLPDPDIG